MGLHTCFLEKITPIGSRFTPKPKLIFWLYFQNPHENSRFSPKTHIKTLSLPLKPNCTFGYAIPKQKSWVDHYLEMPRMSEFENTKRLFTTFQGWNSRSSKESLHPKMLRGHTSHQSPWILNMANSIRSFGKEIST